MGTASKLRTTDAASETSPSRKVNTVGQTLAILRLLANTTSPIGVNAISRELNFAPSSCFRILKQLVEEGYAQLDSSTKHYSLGSATVMLARRSLDPTNTFSLVQPILTDFVQKSQTSVGFWRRIDRDRIVLAGFVEAPNPMRIHMSIGQRLPLFIGAVGRAFAAELGLSEAEIKQELAQLRWQIPPDADAYCRQVEACREKGYAMDEGNFSPGVVSVATVLTDTMGGLSYGISAIRIAGQHSNWEVDDVGRALVELRMKLGSTWLARR